MNFYLLFVASVIVKTVLREAKSQLFDFCFISDLSHFAECGTAKSNVVVDGEVCKIYCSRGGRIETAFTRCSRRKWERLDGMCRGQVQIIPRPPAALLTRHTRACIFDPSCNRDKVPPVFEGCPPDLNVTANARETVATVRWRGVSAQDKVSGPVKVTGNYKSGDKFPEGKTIVVLRASDAEGNVAFCRFTVLVTVIRCAQLETKIRNGTMWCFPSKNFVLGTYCWYRCNVGYTLTDTATNGEIICYQIGWSESVPSCTDINNIN